MARILMIEDDPAMVVALGDGLRQEGYAVVVKTDGEAGLVEAKANPPDLILLDVMLPKMSGHDVCRTLRGQGSGVPVIMLTARSQEMDKVVGLKLGADDYITKPFGFMELLARVEALLRRVKPASEKGIFSFAEVVVDIRRGAVTRAGKPVAASAQEMRLLQYFFEHADELLSRDDLLQAVWGYENAPLTRTVDVHVAKLRKKFGAQHFVTVHRMGYRFLVDPL